MRVRRELRSLRSNRERHFFRQPSFPLLQRMFHQLLQSHYRPVRQQECFSGQPPQFDVSGVARLPFRQSFRHEIAKNSHHQCLRGIKVQAAFAIIRRGRGGTASALVGLSLNAPFSRHRRKTTCTGYRQRRASLSCRICPDQVSRLRCVALSVSCDAIEKRPGRRTGGSAFYSASRSRSARLRSTPQA